MWGVADPVRTKAPRSRPRSTARQHRGLGLCKCQIVCLGVKNLQHNGAVRDLQGSLRLAAPLVPSDFAGTGVVRFGDEKPSTTLGTWSSIAAPGTMAAPHVICIHLAYMRFADL